MTRKYEKLSVVIGNVYGKLTALREERISSGGRGVLCRCACGTEKVIGLGKLICGETVSCGCYRSEKMQEVHVQGHGLSGHLHYGRWWNMMRRCYNESATEYPRYGGRGITVDDFFHDLSNYCAYVDVFLGPPPSDQHTIDRVDNDANYVPGNLRWASKQEQAENRGGMFLEVSCER